MRYFDEDQLLQLRNKHIDEGIPNSKMKAFFF